jgi:hypothetical protein
VNHTANQSSEYCVESSSNIRNGFTGKQIEKTAENERASTDCYCQHSKNDIRTVLPPSIDDHTEQDYDYRNISDILVPSLEPDEDERKLINKNITNAVPPERLPDLQYAELDGKHQDESIVGVSSQSPNEKRTVSVGTQYEIVDSLVQNGNAVPLAYSLREESFINYGGSENCPLSAKAKDVENGGRPLITADSLHASPCDSVQQNYEGIHDDTQDEKQPTQRDIFRKENEIGTQSSFFPNERLYDTSREISLSAVEKPDDQVQASKEERSDPDPATIQDPDQTPNSQPKSHIESSGFRFNESSGTPSEISVPSSVLDVLASESPEVVGEIVDTQLDGITLCHAKECADPTSPSSEPTFQSSRAPSSVSEGISTTHVEASIQHSVALSNDSVEPEFTDTLFKKPVGSLQIADTRKEHFGLDINAQSQSPLTVEGDGERLETDAIEGLEALNSHAGRSDAACDTESSRNVFQGSKLLNQNNLQTVIEAHSLNETNQAKDEVGTEIRHGVIGPGRSSDFENEEELILTSKDSKRDVSESRLDSQTIETEPVILLDEGTVHDSGFSGSSELQPSVYEGTSDALTSSLTSVTPLTVDTSAQLSVSSPLTIDTSAEISASVTPLPADHQSSGSPPKVPSTPKKSKADICWPTFFPGTPVIKRPSVSFATPEAVFTNEDQDVLRQYVDVAPPGVSCLKVRDDDSTAAESEDISTSASDEKQPQSQSQSAGTPERTDSFDEEAEPVIYRERSPSSIIAGNDFSRKELKLQRRRSYKQKRYSSATEIRTGYEETEDRSFSENNPGITRATSLVEPRKRFKKPAKSSSFEDALLCDTQVEGTGEPFLTSTTEEISDVSAPDVRETEHEEPRQQENKNFEDVAEETKEKSDVSGCPSVPTDGNEPKYDKSKPQVEEEVFETKEIAEEVKGDNEEEEFSLSEEQSSSQQKSPPKEAFWVSSEDGIQ